MVDITAKADLRCCEMTIIHSLYLIANGAILFYGIIYHCK